MFLSWIVLCFTCQTSDAVPATRAVSEVLERAASADDALVASLAKELVLLGGIEEVLLDTLVEGRVPGDGIEEQGEDGKSPGLSRTQERVVLEALRAGNQRIVSAFVADVRQHPERVERVAVALRLQSSSGRPSDLDDVRALLESVRTRDDARVELALERGLLEGLARDRKLFDALPSFCGGLSAEHASVVIRALTKTDSPDAPRCLQKLLGLADALQACVLQALASTADLLPRDEAEDLAAELCSQLGAGDELRTVSAANALGRLRVPSSIPALIELLAGETPPVARAALTALRAISGTGLPASPSAWRRWYAAEESWRRARVPDLRRVLEHGAEDEAGRAHLAAALGELSEHPLYRDALAPIASAGLACRDPVLRLLTCAALERLGSRAALPFLCGHLEDANEEVAVDVHRVMRSLARVDLPREGECWAVYLRARGFTLDDTPARARP